MSKLITATQDINTQAIDDWIQGNPSSGEPPAGYKAIEVRLADDRHARLIVPEEALTGTDIARIEAVATAAAERNRK